jgi:two-component system, OmpR family, sensor histidine kinase ArlS
MVDQVDQITATNLDLRLPGEHGKDEPAELAATFNSMLDRLGNSFEAQKQFVSNIAHEIHTPLTAIIGETDLALSQSINNPSYENALKNIHKDAYRLSRLTRSLLDLAKASYDPSEIRLKTVRVDEILLDARNDVLKIDPAYKIELLFDEVHDDIPEISGNEYLLRVAFSNLMENGCKFSAEKKVSAILSYVNKTIMVTFSDRGSGIPENERDDILEPFFRGSNSESVEGSGIGLPLVKRIVQLHKATMEIISNENDGTKVEIRFQ